MQKRTRKTFALMLTMLLAATLPAAAQNPSRELDNQSVADAVADEIRADGAVRLDDIVISSNDGIVTLDGNVDNLLARDRAADLARAVRGVRGVVNLIDIDLDEARPDRRIERDVESALLLDAATDGYQIEATVQDRVVTLAGSVDSWEEKELAGRVAKGVAGVAGLDNRIAVDYAAERADDGVRADVEATLRWDTLVDDGLIDVAVKQGAVELRGVVGSAAEKKRAKRKAWVTGVKAVDAEDLLVERWARDEDLRRGKYSDKTDAAVREAVADALAHHPRLAASDLTAAVANGVVTLRGEVGNLMAKRAAARTARDVVGVTRVTNRIRVHAPVTRSDARIEADVAQALALNAFLDEREVSVEVDANVVHLSGDVATQYEKRTATRIASAIRGVTTVANDIDVRLPEPLGYDPYMNEGYGVELMLDYRRDRRSIAFEKADPQMLRDVEDQLWWSPFVDADDVDVSVDEGIVTLTGTVESWSEWVDAQDNAYEAGAILVDNHLEIEDGDRRQ